MGAGAREMAIVQYDGWTGFIEGASFSPLPVGPVQAQCRLRIDQKLSACLGWQQSSNRGN